MSISVVVTFLLIVLARVGDVSLDAVRTVAIVQGRRLFAATLGFVQAIVYVCVIAKVLQDAEQPVFLVAYALGFALGTWFGIVLEQRMAFGQQMVSLLTSKGAEMTAALVEAGYRLAHVNGHAREGEVSILYVEVARKRARSLLLAAGAVDTACFCVVHDLRLASLVPQKTPAVSGRIRSAPSSNGRTLAPVLEQRKRP